MEDCCSHLPGVVYHDGRRQTCPCWKGRKEDQSAGKQGKGTGRNVHGQVQTLVSLNEPSYDILTHFCNVQNCLKENLKLL